MAKKKNTEDETSHAQEPEGRYRVASHYDSTGHKTRHFALYDNSEGLVFVFANKKSAEAVRARFERDDAVIAEKTEMIGQMTEALAEFESRVLPPQEKRSSPSFQERVEPHRPPEQLALIAADDRTSYRTNKGDAEDKPRTR